MGHGPFTSLEHAERTTGPRFSFSEVPFLCYQHPYATIRHSQNGQKPLCFWNKGRKYAKQWLWLGHDLSSKSVLETDVAQPLKDRKQRKVIRSPGSTLMHIKECWF